MQETEIAVSSLKITAESCGY